MLKGMMSFERESNRLVIPDAYIIEEMSEKSYGIYDESGLALPPSNSLDLDDNPSSTIEESSVIIIDI